MGLTATSVTPGLSKKLIPGIDITKDNPDTRSGGGIDIHTPVGGASVKDESADRTKYEAHGQLPIASGSVEFGENRKTKAIESAHASFGFGSKGRGGTIDGGYDGCTANVGVQVNVGGAGRSPGGRNPLAALAVPQPHVSFNFPIPGCKPNPPPPYDYSKPARKYRTLADFDFPGCGFYCLVCTTLIMTAAGAKWEAGYDTYAAEFKRGFRRDFNEDMLTASGGAGDVHFYGGYIFYTMVPPGGLNPQTNFSDSPNIYVELQVANVIVNPNHNQGALNQALAAGKSGVSPTAKDYAVIKVYSSGASCPTLPDNVDRNTPPPPNSPTRRKMGDCCQATGRQNQEIKDKQDKHDDDLEELKRKVNQIWKVLNPPEFLERKTSIPKRFVYPGATGQEYIMDLPTAFEMVYRQLDLVAGNEQEIKIADANPEKGINQPFSMKFYSLGSMIKCLIENVIESEADVETIENLNIRQTFMLMQILKTATSTWHLAENIEHYLDYHVEHDHAKIKIPFNANVNQGDNKELKDATRTSTRKLLVDLLKEGEMVVETTKLIEKKLLSEMLLEILKYASAAGQALSHEYRGEHTLRQFIESTLIAKHLSDFNIRQQMLQVLGVGDMTTYNADVRNQYTGSANPEDAKDGSVPDRKPEVKKSNKNVTRRKRGR